MFAIWLILFGIGTLVIRAGFAMQASGSLRAKNAAGPILRTVAESAAAGLAFWAVGGAILFGPSPGYFIFDSGLFMNQQPDKAGIEFFHLCVSLIGGAVVGGALAERAKFYVSVLCSAVLAGVVFPVTGHWLWFGRLHELGVIDHGGASVIHLSAAVFAAVGVAVVGARAGKYASDRTSNSVPGHALPLLGIGSVLVFIGWFPYILGSTWTHYGNTSETAFGVAAMNVLLAGFGGVSGGLLLSQIRYGKPDLFFSLTGMLGALVAITPGAVVVGGTGAVMIGLIAGVIVPLAASILDTRAHLDDPMGMISIHGVGSVWGMTATAFFVVLGAHDSVPDHFRIFATQLLGIVAVVVPSAVVATLVFVGLKLFGGVRVSVSDEAEGLDLAEHGLVSYPDFRQQ